MEDNERKNLKALTKVHPKEKANFLSTLFFCWALPTFVKGLKKDLDDDDLCLLKAHESKALADRMGLVWQKEKNKHRIPSLGKVIIKAFYREIISYACFLIIQELVLKMAQPLLVGKLLEYYAPNQQKVTKDMAYVYAFTLILFIFSNILIQHWCFLGLNHLAMKMQIACRSLIYRKALTLNKNALMKSTVGQMVNLMSSDVHTFGYICLHMHQMILAPIQAVIVLYLLYSTVNGAAMVGVGLLMAIVPIQLYFGKLMSFYRRRTAQKTDNRIRLMNEIICGIKIIKMFTWERPFSKLVEMARRLELHEIKSIAYLRAVFRSVNACLTPLSIFLCVLTYILSGNTLQAQFVFVVTSFYGTIRQTLTLHFPRCIAFLAEIDVSLGRIQNFLLAEETQKMSSELKTDDVRVVLSEASFKWTDFSDNGLSDVSFSVNGGELVAVIGRVGSGKSTLLQAILREIDLSKGELVVSGSVSYAAQEPWIFSSSIRQNILFGEKINFERYKEVVKVCALEKDFNLFPYGDRTIVGEKGVMLSGGQKARVSLARAIYKDADIYLLDDPLSAVDTHVGKQLFDQCILGFLKDKARVLVTHQIQYLGKVDEIYLLDRGQVALRLPFAEPPIGDLRFEPPVPKSNWDGVWDATEDRSDCVQGSNTVMGSEDCLFINVYTPKQPSSSCELLPTMVWIYGGGFEGGSSSYNLYGPDYLLEKDVVVVTFNYRLGVLGFLSTGDDVAPGNNGLKDQVLALQWVRDNIKNFCGNPEQVTLAGQSAGSASVAYHLQSPLSEGLFHRAILQSGVSLSLWAYSRRVPQVVGQLAQALEIDNSTSRSIVDSLKQLNTTYLQTKASATISEALISNNPRDGFAMGPVSEHDHPGAFFSGRSHELLSNKKFHKVPIVIGFNSLEGTFNFELLFRLYLVKFDLDNTMLLPIDMNIDSSKKSEAAKKLKQHYFGWKPVSMANVELMKFLSDDQFGRSITEFGRLLKDDAPVYFYRFSYEGGLWGNYNRTNSGVTHSEELGYYWVSNHQPSSDHDFVIRTRMVKLWTNFIKYANPTPEQDPVLQDIIWKPFNNSLSFVDIGEHLVVGESPEQEHMGFWDSFYGQYGNPPYTTY